MIRRILYFDVILRTSIFPAVFGAVVSIYSGVADLSWQSVLAWILCLAGIILVQGVIQHGHDVLVDRGGYSAFRVEVTPEIERKIKRAIKIALGILAVIATIILYLKRLWLIPIGLMALRSAKLYNETHNEWYSVFGFMLSFSVGYFAFTNYPTTGWLIGAMITGFLMKSSQAMYRLDDYLDKEFKNEVQIIQYYRNVFRNTVHLVSILIVALILYFTSSIGELVLNLNKYVVAGIYTAGLVLFIVQVLRLQDKVRQEVNLAPLVGSLLAVEGLAMIMNNIQTYQVYYYIASIVITLWALQRFWRNRHAMCNILNCVENPLRQVVRPK